MLPTLLPSSAVRRGRRLAEWPDRFPRAPTPSAVGTSYSVLVVGDPRQANSAFPFVRDALHRLSARRLPRRDVASLLADAFGRRAAMYATEPQAMKTGVAGRDDAAVELLRVLPKMVVVFLAGGEGDLRAEGRRLGR